MTDWPSGIDAGDIAWVELVRVTWHATESGIARAFLDLHLRDGAVVPWDIDAHGVTTRR